MLKTGLKAFVYSFSVSLFAILTANRCFWHTQKPSSPLPVISTKNISLFLKSTRAAPLPVKKIALSDLPDIPKIALPEAEDTPEVVLADVSDSFDFPLEISTDSVDSAFAEATDSAPFVLADVLYSPQTPLPEPKIEADTVYTPESSEPSRFAPPAAPASKPASKANETLIAARQAQPAEIPLQRGAQKSAKTVVFGSSNDLNHVALNDTQVPISSMETSSDLSTEPVEQSKDWIKMEDSPWVVAKSGGGAKNQMAVKEFSDKSPADISDALNTQKQRPEIQVASETVNNLIIPIPKDILSDENLTPKLAYPASSEDAAKEKLIDEEIKLKELKKENKKEKQVLTALEDDISLDAPKESQPLSQISAPAQKDKPGLINTLSSLFASSKKKVAAEKLKEEALAKAQARRNLKRKQAQARPVSIMPTEIRLSFQPNKAEISGQTLRWIQAFATKAAEAPNIWLEIRIDGTNSTALQQRRLNLLYNILTNKGVDYSKINTVFTTREPNSFILRTLTSDTDNSGGSTGKINFADGGKYIQW